MGCGTRFAVPSITRGDIISFVELDVSFRRHLYMMCLSVVDWIGL